VTGKINLYYNNLISDPMERRKSKKIMVGAVPVGGHAPISVQSMTCTQTQNVRATLAQIGQLEEADCEIVRIAIPDLEAAQAIKQIKKAIHIPLVADIHFDHRLAIESIKQGADKIRINPGTIGSVRRVDEILKTSREEGIPIRIGVNAGSLEKKLIEKYNGVTQEGLVESAMHHVNHCLDRGFDQIVVSIKASNVPLMLEANRLLATQTNLPIHLGLTEAGLPLHGAIRSAVGLGILLSEGIGDTIRVSLTGDPVQEVRAAYEILNSLKLRHHGVTIISCPTCGRLQTNLIPIVEAVDKAVVHIRKPLTVAIMGCAVNGPGEAKEADMGVACGKKSALFFRQGMVIRKIRENEIVETLLNAIEEWPEDSRKSSGEYEVDDS
jgi:(E)-4-hydroxy-3-methylbut-2-enyl-diphosphate synthase